MTPLCHRCHGRSERSEKYDAYFCGRCGLWLEGACGDPDCRYCPDRPPTPPTVTDPPPTKPGAARIQRRYGVTMQSLRESVRRIAAAGPITIPYDPELEWGSTSDQGTKK